MKTLKQVVAAALKDLRAEAKQMGAALGFDRAAMMRDASAELDRWEEAHAHDCAYPRGRARAALALSQILDRAFIDEAGSVKEIDRELAVLRRLAAKQAGQRVAA